MWAVKEKKTYFENGCQIDEDFLEINESWYDVLSTGLLGIYIGGAMLFTSVFVTPFIAVRMAILSLLYSNAPVPDHSGLGRSRTRFSYKEIDSCPK